MKDVSAKWTRADSGQHYVQGRFSSARARGRDPRLVARLLREHGVRPARGGLLDMPCGTGRLGPVLAATGEPVTSVDVALPMLAALTAPPAGFAHSFRFLSQQAFVAARREDATR